MKSRILTALLMLLPFMQLTAYIDEEDGEVIDQFLLTIGTSGYVLWKSVELAHENGFRYVKILSADYKAGNQSGGFKNETKEDSQGALITFEDEVCSLTISCFHFMPSDTDYMDVEEYQELFTEEDSSDEEDVQEDDWY